MPGVLERVEFEVGGMSCHGCEGAVRGALLRLLGVHSASADHTKSRATAEVDAGGVTDAELVAAIEKVGYSARVTGRTSV